MGEKNGRKWWGLVVEKIVRKFEDYRRNEKEVISRSEVPLDMLLTLVERYHNEKEEKHLSQEERERRDMQKTGKEKLKQTERETQRDQLQWLVKCFSIGEREKRERLQKVERGNFIQSKLSQHDCSIITFGCEF